MPGLPTKAAPYSVVSEKAVIGFLLRHPQRVQDFRRVLTDGSVFFRPSHGTVFDALVAAARDDAALDSHQAIERLAHQRSQRRGDAAVELRELAEAASDDANDALRHAGIVRDKANLRRLIETLSGLIHQVYQEGATFDGVVAETRRRLDELEGEGTGSSDVSPRRRACGGTTTGT